MKEENKKIIVKIYNEIIFLFSNINYYADPNGSSGSLFTSSHSNAADWEAGKSDMVLQTSQQKHLSQDQKDHSTPTWNDKAKGTAFTLHINHSEEQGQNNQTPPNHIQCREGTTVHCHLFAKACFLESWQRKDKF